MPLHLTQTPPTPIGRICVALTARGLVAVEIGGDLETFSGRLTQRLGVTPVADTEHTAEASRQITEYLAGERRSFDLPLDWSLCTPFQERVLRLDLEIPYGETRTYSQLARQLGKPKAARAVGRANAANPIPLVIPCHRVIGADGKLRGYGAPGGIKTKAWLLKLERGG